MKRSEVEFEMKYDKLSVKSLKNNLHRLKNNDGDLDEIKYVARLIRSRLKKTDPKSKTTSIEADLNKNFWKSCREIFNKATNSLPTFTMSICKQYFHKVTSKLSNVITLVIPDWIPALTLQQIHM